MNNRTLYIIRGIPGTGKTTLAKHLSGDIIAAADDYFMEATSSGGEEYRFDPKKIGAAHRNCKYRVSEWMKMGIGPISVHNTFVKHWEWKPYIDLCEANGYTPFVIVCGTVFGNTHGVPQEIVSRMRGDFEHTFHNPDLDLATVKNEDERSE